MAKLNQRPKDLKGFFRGIFIFICLVGIVCSCSYVSQKLGIDEEDGVVEELVEEIIHSQTGISIDLTPKSPE